MVGFQVVFVYFTRYAVWPVFRSIFLGSLTLLPQWLNFKHYWVGFPTKNDEETNTFFFF